MASSKKLLLPSRAAWPTVLPLVSEALALVVVGPPRRLAQQMKLLLQPLLSRSSRRILVLLPRWLIPTLLVLVTLVPQVLALVLRSVLVSFLLEAPQVLAALMMGALCSSLKRAKLFGLRCLVAVLVRLVLLAASLVRYARATTTTTTTTMHRVPGPPQP
jgi:hypothetical protein